VSSVDALDVGASVFLGADDDGDPSDNWPGPEQYRVRRAGSPMTGSIVDGVLSADVGEMPIEIALPNAPSPILFNTYGAQINATFDGERLVGTFGGAVIEDEFRAAYLPALQLAIRAIVDDDCPDGACPDDSLGATVLALFDTDADGDVTLEELDDNSLINSLFAPDVDMFDADGNFAPRTDERKESLSIGLAFTAVPAEFDVP
jgi:hypothetical protein